MKLMIVFILLGQVSFYGQSKDSSLKKIIFVCEHGSAKSVVAAAYFNKLSQKNGLNYVALTRGTKPDKEMNASVLDSLKAEGITMDSFNKPVKLELEEAKGAVKIVAFCELGKEYYELFSVESWMDLPPISTKYTESKAILLEHMRKLFKSIEKKN